MEAYGKGTVLNSESGVIDMYGRGNIGMLAVDDSAADNAGKITLDTLWVDQNDTTTLRTDLPFQHGYRLRCWYGHRNE